MKKFWAITLITFSISLTFLTFYITSLNDEKLMDENFTKKVLSIKMNFVRIFRLVESNEIIFDNFPSDELEMDSPSVVGTFNDILSDINSSDKKIKALYVLSEDNQVVSSINSNMLSEYLIHGNGKTITLDESKYFLNYNEDWIILGRNIYDKQNLKVGCLYILFVDEVFTEFSLYKIQDIVVMSSMSIQKNKELVSNNYESISSIVVPLEKFSVMTLSENAFVYKTKLSQNNDIYFVGKTAPPNLHQKIFLYITIASMVVFVLSLILLLFNYILLSKKRMRDIQNEEMNKEMNF